MRRLLSAGLVAAAVLAAGPVPARAADEPEAILKRAEELFAADQSAEAERLFKEALEQSRGPTQRFTQRKAYEGLLALYVKSGRQDKAIRLADPFRAWLKEVRDADGEAELEVTLGECYLGLGHFDTADAHFAAALAAPGPLPPRRRLEALRGRAEVAAERKDPAAAARWAELEAAAADTARRAEITRDNRLRVTAARNRAVALDHLGRTDEALAALTPLPVIHDQLRDPLARRDTQRFRANLLAAAKRYDEAVPLYREAIELHRKQLPKKRMPPGDILAEWAVAAQAAGRRDEAQRLRDLAAAEYKAVIDDPAAGDPESGPLAAFAKLQSLTRSARQFNKALELVQTAGKRWSGDELIASRIGADRGGLELISASYRKARESLAESLARLDAAEPPDLRQLPQVLVNLATAELAGETPDKADPLLRRCAELYARYKLPDDPVRAECDYLRGAAAAQRGEFAAAMTHFRTGLARCDAVGPAAEPVQFNLWLNTALIHKEQADPPAALVALGKAAASLARFAEPHDLTFGFIKAVQADVLATQDTREELKQAVALVPDIEESCRKNGVTGGYLRDTARHLRALDCLFFRWDLDQAERLWSQLAADQRKDGQTQLARTLNYLAIVADLRGRPDDAVRLFREALEFERVRPWCPAATRAITHWRLALLLDRAGQRDEAKAILRQVFDVADDARLLTFGESAQRATFFAQFVPMFETLAACAARDGDGETLLNVIARSRSRTLLDQMLAAGVDPRGGLTGPDREKVLTRERDARRAASRVRSKLQQIPADQADSPDAKKLVAELEAARKEYADAWREIVSADPLTREIADKDATRRAVERIRKDVVGPKTAVLAYMLGRDESYAVLLAGPAAKAEVFRLTVPGPVAARVGDPPPPPTGADAVALLRGIEIGPAGPQPDRPPAFAGNPVPLTETLAVRLIEPYLRQVRSPRFDPTRGITLSPRDAKAEKDVPAQPETVGDTVLPPDLRRRIREAGADTLVVIPDGVLHKIPIECLLVSGGAAPRFALDELPAVCVAPSAAVLAAALSHGAKPGGPPTLLTVADPAYAAVYSPALAKAQTRDASVPIGALSRLPGTAAESERVRAAFPPPDVTALTGPQATERNVVAALPGKRFVHLAAHGFADDRFGSLNAAVALTPPAVADPKLIEPDDDGFLTVPEIYRLKLPGCELTVLSACVTNVGPQRPLEAGVTLGGAFLAAGSRRVLASCWSVSDRATADLMGEFFAAVHPGSGGAVSYPAALKAARQKVRAAPGMSAPFYWAPFVFLGPPD